MHDLVIVGAGPAGLSASCRAEELGLDYVCFERDRAAQTLLTYPRGKDIHYYPVGVQAIGKLPLPEGKVEDTIKAWRELARGLNIKEHEEVCGITRGDNTFTILTNKGEYGSRFVLLAIGVQGSVQKIPMECDDERRVCYKIPEPKEYKGKKVLVVGGGDTAIEHALLLKEAGADVKISYRRPEFFRLKEVNKEAIQKSGIPVIFNSNVRSIMDGKAILDVEGRPTELEADIVAVFAGTIPAVQFLEKIGIKLENNKPVYNPQTFETSITGLFIAGDLTKEPLIKPAINHGVIVINEIAKRLGKLDN